MYLVEKMPVIPPHSESNKAITKIVNYIRKSGRNKEEGKPKKILARRHVRTDGDGPCGVQHMFMTKNNSRCLTRGSDQ